MDVAEQVTGAGHMVMEVEAHDSSIAWAETGMDEGKAVDVQLGGLSSFEQIHVRI